MKFRWTSSNLFIIKFLVSLFIIGLIVGFIAYYRETALVKASILTELKSLSDVLQGSTQNNFLYHVIILSVLSIFSIIILGLPILLFYLFYEGISFGFLLGSLFAYKNFSGLAYGLVLGIVNKLLLYILLIYLLITSINYAKKTIISIRNKDYRIYELITNQIIKISFVFVVILIYDIFIYFFGNKILSYFLFLL